MGKRGADDGREKAARPDGGRDGAEAREEDVFAKQERLFAMGTNETPPQSVE